MNGESAKIDNRSNARLAVACAALGLAIGVAVFVVPRLFDSTGASRSLRLDPHRTVATFPAGIGRSDPNPVRFTPPPRATVPAPTPADALRHFLDARVAGRDDDAWDVVSDRDHRQFPAAGDWVDANGELPRVTRYTLAAPQVRGDRAQINGTVSFVAMLDQIGGLVPAHADVTWVVVRERGNWRVALSESETRPQYPPESAAVSAAMSWAAAQQACGTASQWDGPFLGDADTDGRLLCHARGPVRAGAVRELDDTQAAEPFIAAFGAEVFSWARVVPVIAPSALDVVLAPIGDHWSVVGAIAASPSGSG
jgi:hypothetical protein